MFWGDPSTTKPQNIFGHYRMKKGFSREETKKFEGRLNEGICFLKFRDQFVCPPDLRGGPPLKQSKGGCNLQGLALSECWRTVFTFCSTHSPWPQVLFMTSISAFKSEVFNFYKLQMTTYKNRKNCSACLLLLLFFSFCYSQKAITYIELFHRTLTEMNLYELIYLRRCFTCIFFNGLKNNDIICQYYSVHIIFCTDPFSMKW